MISYYNKDCTLGSVLASYDTVMPQQDRSSAIGDFDDSLGTIENNDYTMSHRNCIVGNYDDRIAVCESK